MIVPGAASAASRRIAPFGRADDGVTALERRERAHGVQGAHQRQQALARAAHVLNPRGAQAYQQRRVARGGVAHAGERACHPKPAFALAKLRNARIQQMPKRAAHALLEFVQAQRLLDEPRGRTHERGASGQPFEALAPLLEAPLHAAP